MIVGTYTATLGSEQALRMPSIGQIGKWLRDVIKSDFSLHPSFNFCLFFHAVLHPHALGLLSSYLLWRDSLCSFNSVAAMRGEPESPCSFPNPFIILRRP